MPEPNESEPERDLNREFFSARPEAEPRELVKTFVRVLVPEATRLTELANDLNREFFSARLEAELSEVVKLLTMPLI